MGSIKADAPTALRRRNFIASSVIPTKLDLPSKPHSSSFPLTNDDRSSYSAVDFELVSLQSQAYTSLKDLMPLSLAGGIQSPTGAGTPCGYEISIRNHLVKQAAWAYLQPMSTSPDSSGRCFFRRMWVRFSGEYVRNPVNACLGFVNRHIISRITGAFRLLIGAIWVGRNSGR